MTSLQTGVWMDQVRLPDSPHYNIGMTVAIKGELDASRMETAIQRVCNEHAALRLVIRQEQGRPVQKFLSKLEIPVLYVDISNEEDSEEKAQQIINDAMNRIFRLGDNSPLWECRLIRVGECKWYWLSKFHHIICDGFGVSIFYNQVCRKYTLLCHGGNGYIEDDFPSFLDFLGDDEAYLASSRIERDRRFWKERFSVLPAALLPATRKVDRSGQGRSGLLDWIISRKAFDEVSEYCQGRGASVASFFLALLVCYFGRTKGVDEVVIGVPVHNRPTARHKRTIGMFASVVPIGVRIPSGASFGELMDQVATELRRCYRHQRLPVSEINRCLNVVGEGRDRIYDISLSFDSFQGEAPLGDILTHAIRVQHRYEQMPLAVNINEYHKNDDVIVEFAYGLRYLSDQEVERVKDGLSSILRYVLIRPDELVENLPLMDSRERDRILHAFNDTDASFPEEALIHQLFEWQVERTPDADAVIFEDQRISYTDLNVQANRLAHALRSKGVRPGTLVAISVERSVEMMVGLLGIMKAGGAYVPIDPDYPEERIAYMLQDAESPFLLTQSHLVDHLLQHTDVEVLLLDDDSWYAGMVDSNPSAEEVGLTSKDLAYVIYTSGSTGLPKGVMNEHRAVVNRLCWMPDELGISADDRILQKTPFSFDGSIWELYWTLMHGATLVMARPQAHRDPGYLAELIDQWQVTIVDFVPSMLQVFLAELQPGGCTSLRHVLCGSEKLPLDLQKRCLAQLPHIRLHNLYGPTEAAADSVYWPCDPDQEDGRVPIGRPISNIRIYILDDRGQPVPVGVPGEMYIAGAGVARGYLNRPELTEERFLPDPFAATAGACMYRTGDVARWRDDGVIEYLGRNDYQVKVRGLRIELGEIEARLLALPQVREAVVVARDMGASDKRLVAYWTHKDPGTDSVERTPDVAMLREYLRQELPDYMVPNAFVHLERMPLTPNGKIDRKALPEPDERALAFHAYAEPEGEMEILLASIWQDLLGVERVGRHDGFFDLGGHSLLMVSMVERLHDHGLRCDIRQVFQARTLAELAASIEVMPDEGAKVSGSLIPLGCQRILPEMVPLADLNQERLDRLVGQAPGGSENIQDIYPLTPLQEGMLFHHCMSQGEDAYVMPVLLAFDSDECLDDFVSAVQVVMDRHGVLRTLILWNDQPRAMQVVMRQAVLPVTYLAQGSDTDTLGVVHQHMAQASLRLDLQKAPLMELRVAKGRKGQACHALLLTHHIVGDHVSLDILLDEVSAVLAGRRDGLTRPAQYRDFAAYCLKRTEDLDRENEFFRSYLGDVSEVTAPFGLTEVLSDGSDVQEETSYLSPSISTRIRAVMARLGMSPSILFHVAYAQVLAAVSGKDDVVFGTVLSGRMGAVSGIDRMMGMFINTLPIRVRVGNVGVLECMRQVHERFAQLLQHEHASLASVQRCSGVGSGMPLFSALFNYRHSVSLNGAQRLHGIEVVEVRERTNYPFDVSVDDLGEDFIFTIQILSGMDPHRVLKYLTHTMEQLVCVLESSSQVALSRLSILPQEEQEQVLQGFNATEVEYPREALIHELFEQQVEKTPEAVAVQYEGERLTYAELNAKANQLAHRLRSLTDDDGHPVVRPDALVAISV